MLTIIYTSTPLPTKFKFLLRTLNYLFILSSSHITNSFSFSLGIEIVIVLVILEVLGEQREQRELRFNNNKNTQKRKNPTDSFRLHNRKTNA